MILMAIDGGLKRWLVGVTIVSGLVVGLFSGLSPTASEPGWPLHVIVAGANGAGNADGADGVQGCDFDGDGLNDMVVGHEQGLRVTLSFNPGPYSNLVESPWPTVFLGGPGTTFGSVEDAVCGDVNEDGALDIVAASETGAKRVSVMFAPAPPNTRTELLDSANWTRVDLDASANNRSMRAKVIDIAGDSSPELVVGGKESDGPPVAAALGYYSSETPTDGASWTFTSIVPVGWVMDMYVQDFNGDGDIDIIYSDRDPIDTPGSDTTKRGVRWLESDGADPPAFTEHAIGPVESFWKWFDVYDWDGDTDLDIIACRSSPDFNESSIFINGGGGTSWSEIVVPQPARVGQCQEAFVVDVDGADGVDLAFSYSNAQSLSAAVWYKVGGTPLSPTFTRNEISGVLSTTSDVKMDNQYWGDLDGDTDLDLVLTEQHVPNGNGPGIGIVYLENPLIQFIVPPTPPGVSCSLLTSGSSTTDGTSVVTASFAPSANALVIATFASALAAGPTAPTLAGNGLTYVQQQTQQYAASNARRVTSFRAMGASPSAGAITATWGASQTSFTWTVVECTGVDTGGTNGSSAVPQSTSANASAATSITVTLPGALAAASSNVLGYTSLDSQPGAGIVPDVDGTELGEATVNTGPITSNAWNAVNQTAMTSTFTSSNAGAIILEVKASP